MNGIFHSVTSAERIWGPDGKPRKSRVREGMPDITGICIIPLFVRGKAAGVCRVADIPYPLYIEVKTKEGRVSKVQAACHREIEKRGVRVCVPRSLEDVEKFLLELGVELKARISV